MFNEGFNFLSISYVSNRLSFLVGQLENKKVTKNLRNILKLEYFRNDSGAVFYHVVTIRDRISYTYNTKEYDFESFCYLMFLELQKDILPFLCSFYNNFSDKIFNYAQSQIAANNNEEQNVLKQVELV